MHKIKAVSILVMLLMACNEPQVSENVSDKLRITEKVSTIIIPDADSTHETVITLGQRNEIQSIIRYSKEIRDGEALIFHAGGRLQVKSQYVNDVAEGFSYFFYPSGVLEHLRQFRQNIPFDYAIDYYDTIQMIRTIHQINDSGKVFRRKNFDRQGVLMSIEP